jgi:hypothetical protein
MIWWMLVYIAVGVGFVLAACRQHAEEIRRHHADLVCHRGRAWAWGIAVAGAAAAVVTWPVVVARGLAERAR